MIAGHKVVMELPSDEVTGIHLVYGRCGKESSHQIIASWL
jgi:hypothetical protein